MRRLGAEICLAFNLTGLSDLTKLLIIHTCGEQCNSYYSGFNLGVGTLKGSQDKPEKLTGKEMFVCILFLDTFL